MKVLQINSVCGIGSTGRIVTDIHNTLTQQGHQSYIAYGRNRALGCSNPMKIGTSNDIYQHIALTRFFDKHGFGSKKATIELIKEIEEIDPDVIHLHNIHGYYINIEILFDFLKKFNKRVVWTLHDCWAFTGHCSYFDYVGCEKWKSGCESCPQKGEYPKSILFDNSKENYQRKQRSFTGVKDLVIVTPSNWLAKLVQQSFLKEYPVHVINNGIDLDVFKPTEGDFRKNYGLENKFIILGVANVWEKRKGFDYFLKLSAKLQDDERIVLVGVTAEQKAKLPQNIIGITRTNNTKELAEIYSTADIFLNPTLEDNFPTVNIEALACGTPVFTFNTGGSIECVDEKVGKIINKNEQISIDYRMTSKFDSLHCVEKARMYDRNRQYAKYVKIFSEGVK